MTHLRLNQASLLKTLYIYIYIYIYIFFFFFLGAIYVFGLLYEQYFYARYVLVLSNNLHLFICDMFVGIFLIHFQL